MKGIFIKGYFDVTYGSCNERPRHFSKCLCPLGEVNKVMNKRANKVITQCDCPFYEDPFQSDVLFVFFCSQLKWHVRKVWA